MQNAEGDIAYNMASDVLSLRFRMVTKASPLFE